MSRVLVYGVAVAGAAVARALTQRGYDVVAADDRVDEGRRALAADLGVELFDTPDTDTIAELLATCELVVPAPGIPEHHRLIAAARRAGVELVSEIELAYRWEAQRPGGPRPMLAITGTDGKTTTTLLTVEMLRAAGLQAIDAGNTDTPLVEALDLDVDVFAVECTSFRLAWTRQFRPAAGVWLNLAPDHLDWHTSLTTYRASKARLWAAQTSDDVAIGFADDATVMAELATAPGRHRTFSVTKRDADYHLDVRDDPAGVLTGPSGPLISSREVARNRPHDLSNTLAAAALVLETGLADVGAVAAAARRFVGPAHRLEHLGTWSDIAWYNDSKATTPHAAAAAIGSFERIVLIAGGYDKGVDLAAMAGAAERVDTVIALGDTADAVLTAFAAVTDRQRAADLPDAVARAGRAATPGSTVLLSPGCASFDAYSGFEARGDHFRELVLERHAHRTVDGERSTQDTRQSALPPDAQSQNGALR
ncbi:MAG: UDP-N-acetylmuramoyl-L-alanine--D-glutamate ligase [Ilumatobacteraceae bacterium]|nr:UDP-N-acetylmuramoyl-L-alanine--D-glutamate ligase [Ilumatobacteraceae bacterium]